MSTDHNINDATFQGRTYDDRKGAVIPVERMGQNTGSGILGEWISDSDREDIYRQNMHNFQRGGLRVLAFACKQMLGREIGTEDEDHLMFI